MILMDLPRAFDTLNHDLLIAKLHAYGFQKNPLINDKLTDKSLAKNKGQNRFQQLV